jgi:hypothetical protein
MAINMASSISIRPHRPNSYDEPAWIVIENHNPDEKRGALITLKWFTSPDNAAQYATDRPQTWRC